jgi:hypothetical protein
MQYIYIALRYLIITTLREETVMSGWEEGDWRDESLCQFAESNLLNKMGLEFYDLSHPWGLTLKM